MKIRLEQVSFSYPGGVEALREISLVLETGQVIGLIGENGAGKTTLAKHLNGLLKPGSGEVFVGDWNTRRRSVAQLARCVGFVFQNPDEQLFERSVRQEVAFGPRNLGQTEEQIERNVNQALRRLGIDAFGDIHPYDLIPSERKLVALAASLAMDTPFLVLDEPTMGMDSGQIQRIDSVIEGLGQKERCAILITHDLEFCLRHAHRIIVLNEGRVLLDGEPGQVFRDGSLLDQARLDPPQLVRLAQAIGLSGTPSTPGRFVDQYEEERRSAA
jgi:energy-coupling factor transport system ATP-binding protein